MIIDYLKEAFHTADKFKTNYFNGYAEIYKNPTPREMRDIARNDLNDEQSIRMGLDTNGQLYAWNYLILHDEMAKYLGTEWDLRFEYNYPEKEIWLGADTSEEEWAKYGTDELIMRLGRAVPGLNAIKYTSGDTETAWERE